MGISQVAHDLKFRHGILQLERGEALALALDAVEDRDGFVCRCDLRGLRRTRQHRLHLVAGLLAGLENLLGRLVLFRLLRVLLELTVGGHAGLERLVNGCVIHLLSDHDELGAAVAVRFFPDGRKRLGQFLPGLADDGRPRVTEGHLEAAAGQRRHALLPVRLLRAEPHEALGADDAGLRHDRNEARQIEALEAVARVRVEEH
mmetsp:Transcript_6588/g.16746  ORF Transcript_6588/g.16746 Transcript_6588/m.16746 type:complete len:203 (+) Transcript_6588:434-1042(+)